MRGTYRPMLCVEVLEARLALSAVAAADVVRPDYPLTAEVGPEPVAVGTDKNGETIYAISVPPRQCMCASCLGTWDGPSTVSSVRPANPPAPTVEPEGGAIQADRTGSPDVIAQAALVPTNGLVALPPAPTVQTWPTPEASPSDPAGDVSRDGAADQIVVSATTAESDTAGDGFTPTPDDREADGLALALTV